MSARDIGVRHYDAGGWAGAPGAERQKIHNEAVRR